MNEKAFKSIRVYEPLPKTSGGYVYWVHECCEGDSRWYAGPSPQEATHSGHLRSLTAWLNLDGLARCLFIEERLTPEYIINY